MELEIDSYDVWFSGELSVNAFSLRLVPYSILDKFPNSIFSEAKTSSEKIVFDVFNIFSHVE